MKLDHVVILVRDLAQAMGDYAARGYTVMPGGEHVNGETHNALVALADGAYLELIAFKVPFSQSHRWQRYRAFPGVIDYCLGVDALEPAIQACNLRGLSYGLLPNGGRKRPDGVELQWRSGLAPVNAQGLPFMIEDVTPRQWRVPDGAAAAHANKVVAIAQLDVLVGDLARAKQNFDILLGPDVPSFVTPAELLYDLNGTTLRLFHPQPKSIEAQLLGGRGAGAYRLHLRRKDGSQVMI
ncbi:MAG: VOC family protein [Anaerolineae bacterium]|nr:VOC family protein [Anaerolineae bacterium]